jgi:hypothetical protein
MAAADVSEQLAREDSGRTRAIAGALIGAVLPLAAAIIATVSLVDQPKSTPGQLIFVHQHATALILVGAVTGLGALGIALVLRYLYDATAFRRPETPRVAKIMATYAPPAYLLSQILLQVALAAKASDFVDKGPLTYQHARDIVSSGAITGASALGLAAQLGMGFAFVLVSLNAMRAGILTRFMGFVGIIVGVLFVIPIGSPLPVVQSFWLLTVAYLISGRWPNGVPPAWASGQAEPWPTMAEQREASAAAEGGSKDRAPSIEPPVAPEPARPLHPSSNKRKKKRRR